MARNKLRVKAFIIANAFLILGAIILAGIFSKRCSSSVFKEIFKTIKDSKELF